MIYSTTSRRARRAFTLIESLMAMVVLTFCMLSLFGLVSATFGYTEKDSEHIQAVSAGQQYLDTIRQAVQNAHSLPTAPSVAVDPGFGMTGSQITSTQNFTMTNNSCPIVTGSLMLYNCVVTVQWTQGGASQSVSIQSYVAQQ